MKATNDGRMVSFATDNAATRRIVVSDVVLQPYLLGFAAVKTRDLQAATYKHRAARLAQEEPYAVAGLCPGASLLNGINAAWHLAVKNL